MAKLRDLTPDASNANRGTERGRYALETSLRKYGAGRSILIDRNGRIIAGNKTAETAADVGMDDVIIVQTDGRQLVAVQRTDLDLDSKEARELAYADNRVAELDLSFDPEQMLADMQAGVDLEQFWRKDELDDLFADLTPNTEGDTEPQTDRAEELREKWGVVSGQLWELDSGNGHAHRLICGDCTDAATVARLGEFTAINSDPPYGIDVVGSDGRIGLAAKFGRIEGDMKPFDPAHLLAFSVNTVLWGGNHYADKLPASSAWLVWDKRDGDRRNDFADCELAWCSGGGVARVFRHLWMGYARASERDEKRQHPTQKPVAVIQWSMQERTTPDDVIADFYVGSGTTLIACENLSRRCRACEISPVYVAVALQRWADHTQRTPVLLEAVGNS